MRVIELYSGIGGMHHALKESCIGNNSNVVLAIDINPFANSVYRHNFPKTELLACNMDNIKIELLEELKADMILMSPPCQPFTRIGLQRDINDKRTVSLLHLMSLFRQLTTVRYIVLENVKGFETSATRDQLISKLHEAEFFCEEFLLNPLEFGICNSRLRYYLLAKKSDCSGIPSEIRLDSQTVCITKRKQQSEGISRQHTLGELIEKELNEEYYSVDDVLLKRYYSAIDIVSKDSKQSCCFTKNYGRYLKGTGSLYSPLDSDQLKNIYDQLEEHKDNEEQFSILLRQMKLRFFTPSEIAKLMGFRNVDNLFPSQVNTKQKYRLLGNSVNVHVVSHLISYITNNNNNIIIRENCF